MKYIYLVCSLLLSFHLYAQPGIFFDEDQLTRTVGTEVISDPTAFEGKALMRASNASAETFFYGPYTSYKAGDYLVQFRVKVSSNVSSSQICRLDVYSNAAGGILASVTITPSLFKSSNEWQLFTLPAHITQDVPDLEVRGIEFIPGICDLYLDYVNVMSPNVLTIGGSGNVGINTTSPSSPLTISSNTQVISLFKLNGTGNGNISIANNVGQLALGVGAITQHPYAWSNTGKFYIGHDGDPTLFVDGMMNGNVGIGTQDTKGHKLAVAGTALFTKVTVKALPWADYVFHANYRLRPLSEVEQYIKHHGHLPEVPTAEEVEKNGLDVGDNQATLLKKIEELTLYVIEQNKKIAEQEKKQAAMQEEIRQLKGMLKL